MPNNSNRTPSKNTENPRFTHLEFTVYGPLLHDIPHSLRYRQLMSKYYQIKFYLQSTFHDKMIQSALDDKKNMYRLKKIKIEHI